MLVTQPVLQVVPCVILLSTAHQKLAQIKSESLFSINQLTYYTKKNSRRNEDWGLRQIIHFLFLCNEIEANSLTAGQAQNSQNAELRPGIFFPSNLYFSSNFHFSSNFIFPQITIFFKFPFFLKSKSHL